MKSPRSRKQITLKNSLPAAAACAVLVVPLMVLVWWLWPASSLPSYKYVSTIAGTGKEIGEPFGVAVRDGVIFVSDGQNDKIWRIDGGRATVFAEGFDTPSGIAFDKNGNLIVADTGSNMIKSVSTKGEVSVLVRACGVSKHQALETGQLDETPLNGPVGVAAGPDGRVYFSDTYNDRLCVIEKGQATTLAGTAIGYADGIGVAAKFDTPTGIAIWHDKVLVADTGNRRIRVIEPHGEVWTLAGTGDGDAKDGLVNEASFVQPAAISIDANGMIFIADGNAIRRIGGNVMPFVTTVSSPWRGLADGSAPRARFNRPSGLAIDANGRLIVADSENRLVRRFSASDKGTPVTDEQIAALRDKPEEFRLAAPARWPYDPPSAKRDVAGTLGEIRGEMTEKADNVWFHNGLDIAGSYGETARFIRDEKVLRLVAAENFGTLRELIRMPTIGYIHIKLGRNADGGSFGDARFQFQKDGDKLIGIRVPRGGKFKAGEPIGTLNPMNHVHLIAGRSGSEMNALDALVLPGISDARPPVIENVKIYDQNWNLVETVSPESRIKVTEKSRLVVRAFDQMDGNAERRRLGVYKIGYQFVRNGEPVGDAKWTIVFDRMPSNDAVRFAYGIKSHSGATGETIFNYIASNHVSGDDHREAFLDITGLSGNYTLRALAADYFGNTSSKDIEIEVLK